MARRQYENSPADIAEDRRGAGLLNITPKQYERTARDRAEDAAGQRRLSKGPVSTTIRGKAAAAEMQKMQRQAARNGGKTTGKAAAAQFAAMQRQAAQQQAKKIGRR